MALHERRPIEVERSLGVRTWHMEDLEEIASDVNQLCSAPLVIMAGDRRCDDLADLRRARRDERRNVQMQGFTAMLEPQPFSQQIYVVLGRRNAELLVRDVGGVSPDREHELDVLARNYRRHELWATLLAVPWWAWLLSGLGLIALLTLCVMTDAPALTYVIVAVASLGPILGAVAGRRPAGSAHLTMRSRAEVLTGQRSTRQQVAVGTLLLAIGSALTLLVGWLVGD